MSELRWRKFSPIDRDAPIFELLDGDVIILDITRGETLDLEMAFHEGAVGRVLGIGVLERLLAEAKSLMEKEDVSG